MTLHTGDCLEVMAGMADASVDAVVTDPPYGIGFMGKAWDAFDADPVEASWSGRGRNTESKRNPAADTPGGRSTERTGFRDTNPRCGVCGRVTRGRDTAKGYRVCHCKTPVIVGTPNRDAQRYQAWTLAWAREAFRVTVPGGYLLAFGGTRTHHRLVCGLEDAGWLIRDELDWVYASGFPKGKANLKPAHEPIVLARKPGPLRMLNIDGTRIPAEPWTKADGDAGAGFSTGKFMGSMGIGEPSMVPGGERTSSLGRWPSNLILTDPVFDGGVDGVVGGGDARSAGPYPVHDGWTGEGYGGTFTQGPLYGDSGTYSRFYRLPTYNDLCASCGAPIAGGPSSDGATTDTPSVTAPRHASSPRNSSRSGHAQSATGLFDAPGGPTAPPSAATSGVEESGSSSDRLSTSGSERTSSPADTATTPPTRRSKRRGTSPASTPPFSPAKSPAAESPATGTTTTTVSRYLCVTCAVAITSPSTSEQEPRNYPFAFLIPKADRGDREPVIGGSRKRVDARMGLRHGGPGEPGKGSKEGYEYHPAPRVNVHPTTKPIELMRHLVRLVTPTGGRVLDPFLGSGTTAIACEMEGFAWIGIEKEPEYVAIAEARLNGVQKGLGFPA